MVTKLTERRRAGASRRAAARFARLDAGRQPATRRPATLAAPRASLWRQLAARNAWREVANVAAITFAYFTTRGIIRGREDDAFANAQTLIAMERSLGIYQERAVQGFALANDWLVTFANNYYLYGHLPVLVAVAVWLFWWRPAVYPWFRNAFIISAAIGLTIYVAVPLAPPRFLPGFVDTMRASGFDVDGSAAGPLYNPYAAMPSLHTGWSVLSGFAIVIASGRWWGRALGVILPALMVVAVVMTGNHFFLDAVVGSAVVFLALALGWAVLRGPWMARQAEPCEVRNVA